MKPRIATLIAGGLAAVALIATVAAVASQLAAPAGGPAEQSVLAVGTDIIPPVVAQLTAGPIPRQPTDPESLSARVDVAPSRIAVASVGIDMPVVSQGLAPDGSMALPEESATAAWYRHGGVPGDPERAVLIAGHISSYIDGVGPFSLLPQVNTGDAVAVTLTDGSQESFTVVRAERISKQTVDYDAITAKSPGMLILVTCGGEWDARNRSYEDNVIVWAVSEVVP